MQKYGGQVALAAPIDRGFNRLAWLLPYSLGAAAAGGLGYRPGGSPAARPPPARSPAAIRPRRILSFPTSWMTSSAILTERSPRRIPLLVYGLGGALLAAAFAYGVEKLRFGPPLVMIGLGG